MKVVINTISENSNLAEASYGKFEDARKPNGSFDGNKVRAVIQTNGNDFSDTQAAEFVTHWRVVDHQPETTSGFSATLFQRIDSDPESGLKAGSGS